MEHRLGAGGSGISYGRHSWMAGERGSDRIVANHGGCDGVVAKGELPRPYVSRTDDVDKDKIISSLQSQVEEQVSPFRLIGGLVDKISRHNSCSLK
jgi:hypothetical protein